MEKSKQQFYMIGLPQGSGLRRVSLEEHIKYTLRAALLTSVGERKLSPEMGSNVRDMLFRPLLNNVRVELKSVLLQAVQKNEPRVEVEKIEVDYDPSDQSRLSVLMDYRVLQTSKRDQMALRIQ